MASTADRQPTCRTRSAERSRRALRALDVASLLAFLGLMIGLAVRLWPFFRGAPRLVVGIALAAYVSADFASGFFHWLGDTWATPETTVVGAVFIRPFREHHFDPLAIVRHDFIEVNGANCLISLPVAAATHCLPLTSGHPGVAGCAAFTGIFLIAIFTTNQFHKWAHMERPPAFARALQRTRVILGAEHHRRHHAAPFDTYYCITTGWLNGLLHRARFFRALEWLVSSVTGLTPHREWRSDG